MKADPVRIGTCQRADVLTGASHNGFPARVPVDCKQAVIVEKSDNKARGKPKEAIGLSRPDSSSHRNQIIMDECPAVAPARKIFAQFQDVILLAYKGRSAAVEAKNIQKHP